MVEATAGVKAADLSADDQKLVAGKLKAMFDMGCVELPVTITKQRALQGVAVLFTAATE